MPFISVMIGVCYFVISNSRFKPLSPGIIKVKSAIPHEELGSMLISLIWARRWVWCMAHLTPCLPSQSYDITTLWPTALWLVSILYCLVPVTHVWTTCPRLLLDSGTAGSQLVTFESQLKSNTLAIKPPVGELENGQGKSAVSFKHQRKVVEFVWSWKIVQILTLIAFLPTFLIMMFWST